MLTKLKKSKKVNRVMNVFRGPRNHILIACFQKSGSTYLCSILKKITDFRAVQLCQRYGNNEQDMDISYLKQKNPIDYICQQHVKGTENNLALIQEYGLRPIVHVRNICDVVYSLRDHFKIEDHRTPTGYVHREYFDMPEEDKLMYLIRIHLPWYFNFMVSWIEASKTMEYLWTSYEELFNDQAGTIAKILDYCEIPHDDVQIAESINSMKSRPTRLNVGKAGRGKSLPSTHREEILKLASVWHIDKKYWEKIGLDSF